LRKFCLVHVPISLLVLGKRKILACKNSYVRF
jgi:hypothetical protein